MTGDDQAEGTRDRQGGARERKVPEHLRGAAGAAGERGMPKSSPWQRAQSVWHRSGVDWVHDQPSDSDESPDPGPGPATSGGHPIGGQDPAGDPQLSANAAVPGQAPPPGSMAPTAPTAPYAFGQARPRQRKFLLVAIAVPVALLLAGAGGAYAFSGGDEKKPEPPRQDAIIADQLFPAADSPAAGKPALLDLASAGNSVTAVGGTAARGVFLASPDGGRTWRLAPVRATDGDEPPLEDGPRFVAAGQRGWAALGGEDGSGSPQIPRGIWTSRDGMNWTRQRPSAAFAPGDHVSGLAYSAWGFVAVGGQPGSPVVWTSPDGAEWQRITPPLGDARMTRVVAHGNAVIAHGSVTAIKTVTKKKKRKGKKAKKIKVKVKQTSEAFWRSVDAGKSWKAVSVPQSRGSYGSATGLTAAPAGFLAVREAKHTTGKKKKKKTKRYAVVFGSPDGTRWSAVGQLGPGVTGLGGSEHGATALTRSASGKSTVLQSADGKAWRNVGSVGAVTDAAVTPAGVVTTGDQLTVAAKPVDLATIQGVVRSDRAVAALASASGQNLAVGSADGDAAVWQTLNPAVKDRWTRAQSEGDALTGPGDQRLTDVAHGPKGWVAAGRSGTAPLVVTSSDGGSWRKASGDALSTPTDGTLTATAAAYGKAYVVAGQRVSKGLVSSVVWTSADLKKWQAAEVKDGGIRDIVATGPGYVAVGGRTTDGQQRPAAWVSADGEKWTPSQPPPLPAGTQAGAVTRVLAHGGTLIASGTATAAGQTAARPFVTLSPDGGKTWQAVKVPETAPGTTITAATITPKGYVLAVAFPAGQELTVFGSGRSDAGLWTSADGRSWRMIKPHGTGVDGRGAQTFTGLTVLGTELLAAGSSGDYRGSVPTLWRAPLP